MRIDENKILMIGMSNSMRIIARCCFPNAIRTIGRFHIQKLACDAFRRYASPSDGMQSRQRRMLEIKPNACKRHTLPIVLTNGTRQSNCLHAAETCFLSRQDKWTESQRQRAKVLFEIYLDLKEAYSLTHSLSMIFSRNAIKVLLGCSLRAGMTKWTIPDSRVLM